MRYQRVYTSIWHDQLIKSLTEDARNLFIYLITSPHTNILGAFVIPKGYIVTDLKWTLERLQEPFAEVLHSGLIDYDETVELCVVKNHLKHNPIENQNQVTAAIKVLQSLPKSKKDIFVSIYFYLKSEEKEYFKPLLERLAKRLHKGLHKHIGKPETETETETEYLKEKEKEKEKEKDPPLSEKEKKEKERTKPTNEQCNEIISFMNEVAGTEYPVDPVSEESFECISGRWNGRRTVSDFKKVIANMTLIWKGDPKMEQYLRQETLFGKKFDSYKSLKPEEERKKLFSDKTSQSIEVAKEWMNKREVKQSEQKARSP